MSLCTCRLCPAVLWAVSLLVLPIGFSSVAAEDGAEIRVMSFNIRYGTARDGDNAWPHRRELVVQTIRAFDPDLLGTQETLPFQAEYLSDELPGYTKVGWTRDGNKNGEQCAVFFRADRFELVDSGQYWLSETPDEKFTKSWDSSLPRVTTWVVLRDRSNDGSELVFANTHFDHRGARARLESAKLIHERIRQLDGKAIVLTGDFNCPEGSDPWKALTSSGLLQDTRRVAHPLASEEEGTFNGFRAKARPRRIDWILATSHFNVRSADIDRTSQDGRYPSDHFPVTAVLSR